MSELTKLLEGVKVEWKTLGEISELYGGLKGKSKNDFTDGNAKYVTYKNIFNNIEINFDTLESVKVSPTENQYEIRYGDVLFTGSSEIASEAGMSSSVTKSSDTKIYLNSFSFGLRFNPEIKLIPEFTKYLFRSKYMRDAITKTASGVTRYNISKKRFVKLLIPIPCPDNPEKSLRIQQEIVRILDRLSEETKQLNAALQKELYLHQKQYDFYREKLFKFVGKEVEWRSLAEVFDLKNGYTPSKQNKEYWTNGTVPWFRMEDIRRNGRVLSNSIQHVSESAVKGGRLFPANSIIVATSATIGEYALITVPYLSNQRFTNLSIKNNFADIFIMKFMVHYSYLLGEWCKKNVTVGNFAGVDMGGFKKFPIAIPSLIDQERIVKILDELDAKTQAITTAIQKEIALRNKQYQYYRDRLLSFQSLQTEAEAIQ